MTDADYDYIWMRLSLVKKLSLNGMLVLIVMMNSKDDNNNDAIFNAVLYYIMIRYQYVNIIWIFLCFLIYLVNYLTV